MRTAVDSSVLVATLLTWHERHAAARDVVERLLAAPEDVVLAADVLLETYSVLTRLPAPHRLAPADAEGLLRENFRRCRTESLSGGQAWTLLRSLPERGVAGGTVYDARIVAAVLKGGASRILTFNVRHFERLVPEGLEVVVPGA